MPHVVITEQATGDLQRLQDFLEEKSPAAAAHAVQKITKALLLLEDFPDIGQHNDDLLDNQRELLVDYGKSGYVVLYEKSGDGALVFIVAIRHQLESGYIK